jgi:hypothetical protein
VFVFRLFNNTSSDIVAFSYDSKMEPEQDSIRVGEAGNVRVPSKLIVRGSGFNWEYDSRLYNRDYVYGWNMKSFQNLQLESNGAIYVLLPGAEHTMTRLPPQPEGFPVMPKK